jgi:hypothetical protein
MGLIECFQCIQIQLEVESNLRYFVCSTKYRINIFQDITEKFYAHFMKYN